MISAFPGLSIGLPLLGVGLWIQRQARIRFAVGDLLVQAFEVGDAPAAAGARGQAFGDQAGDRRLFAAAVVHDLALGNAKAQADERV